MSLTRQAGVMAVEVLDDFRLTLDAIASHPERALELRPETALALLARAAAAQAALMARLVAPSTTAATPESTAPPDRTISLEEAAALIHRPRQWIVRNRKRLPWVHRISRKTFVASERAVRRWVAAQPR